MNLQNVNQICRYCKTPTQNIVSVVGMSFRVCKNCVKMKKVGKEINSK